jgi:putative tryptophan/tyrosine transport system substrate-binding protein
VAAWPLPARAQQAGKLPTIGFLGQATASAQSQWTAAFLQRLRELGWEEGRTISIEYRWAEGHFERFAEIATEFADRKVDVIVTAGTAPVLAAKHATSVIPIVFAAAGNPVATGLVTSLARPGGNVTGLSNQATDVASKRIELMREVLPDLRKLAVLVNIASPIGVLEIGEVEAAARTLGVAVVPLEIRRREDIAVAIEGAGKRAQAIYTVSEPLVASNRLRINMLALGERLPTMHDYREYVEMGGLMSYGPNFPDLYRRAANLVDKILRGAKPGTLPVEQPTKFELVVNLITARALGLEIPPTMLARADEVIE